MSIDLDTNLSLCDEDFQGKLNLNFETIASRIQTSVIAILPELPSMPSEGDTYLITQFNPPFYYVYKNGQWVGYEVTEGELYFVESEGSIFYYNGTQLEELSYEADIDIESLEEATELFDSDLFLVKQDDNKKISFEDLVEEIQSRISTGGGSQVPVGSVLAFAGTVVPSGYLRCDGLAISRYEYADLYAAIGEAHGSGNGVTTFNVPDYREMFLRMIGPTGSELKNYDPDRLTRTAMNAGGNTGAQIGSVQSNKTFIPNNVVTSANGQHTHEYYIPASNSGGGVDASASRGFTTQNTSTAGVHTHTVLGGDQQTAPWNAYVNYIIKAKNE